MRRVSLAGMMGGKGRHPPGYLEEVRRRLYSHLHGPGQLDRARRKKIRALVAGSAATILALLAACGGGPSAQGPPPSSPPGETTERPARSSTPEKTSVTNASVPGVFFPKQKPITGTPDAMTRGTLIKDDEGCLRLRERAGQRGIVPLWPAKYGLDKRGGSIVVLDGGGQVLARVGDEVVMGGGVVARRTLEGNEVLDEPTERELFKRCPGTYWLVSTLQASQRR